MRIAIWCCSWGGLPAAPPATADNVADFDRGLKMLIATAPGDELPDVTLLLDVAPNDVDRGVLHLPAPATTTPSV